MTPREHALTTKNVKHWGGAAAKLEAIKNRTEDQNEELAYRKAQIGIWQYQLKHGTGGVATDGDISSSSSMASSESAGGTK